MIQKKSHDKRQGNILIRGTPIKSCLSSVIKEHKEKINYHAIFYLFKYQDDIKKIKI